MNCLYCKTSLDGGDAGIFNCIKCPVPVRYICSGKWSNPEIWYIQFTFNHYLIEIKVLDQICNIFYFPEGLQSPLADIENILFLDYVPDITPSTAQAFLDRVLALKAFF